METIISGWNNKAVSGMLIAWAMEPVSGSSLLFKSPFSVHHLVEANLVIQFKTDAGELEYLKSFFRNINATT